MSTKYTVIVGNIGSVLHEGASFREALAVYREYVRASKADHGRAAGENVTMFRDGEPVREYVGTLFEDC